MFLLKILLVVLLYVSNRSQKLTHTKGFKSPTKSKRAKSNGAIQMAHVANSSTHTKDKF